MAPFNRNNDGHAKQEGSSRHTLWAAGSVLLILICFPAIAIVWISYGAIFPWLAGVLLVGLALLPQIRYGDKISQHFDAQREELRKEFAKYLPSQIMKTVPTSQTREATIYLPIREAETYLWNVPTRQRTNDEIQALWTRIDKARSVNFKSTAVSLGLFVGGAVLVGLLWFLLFQLPQGFWEWLATHYQSWSDSADITAWSKSIPALIVALVVAFLTYYTIRNPVRRLAFKTKTKFDELAVSALAAPLSVSLVLLVLYPLVHGASWWVSDGQEKGIPLPLGASLSRGQAEEVLIIAFVAWLAVIVLRDIICYLLKLYAEKTRTTWDDMAVRLLQVYGQLIIIAIVGGVVMSRFGLRVDWYAIGVSVVGVVLLYASRDGLENFFGGMYINIDRPFTPGDRIVLAKGEVCDVESVGFRSTTLYNIIEHTEIRVPNSVMAKQEITNLSRPDLELRLQLDIPLRGGSIKTARLVCKDILYQSPDVTKANIGQPVSDDSPSLLSLLEKWDESDRKKDMQKVLDSIIDSRRQLLPRTEDACELRETQEDMRRTYGRRLIGDWEREKETRVRGQKSDDRNHLQHVEEAVEKAKRIVYTEIESIRQQAGTAGDYFASFVSELSKEPVVRGEYSHTDEGKIVGMLTLYFYTPHLERRFEVEHSIVERMQEEFKEESIPLFEWDEANSLSGDKQSENG